jgi:uroporphyrinogen-III synthase
MDSEALWAQLQRLDWRDARVLMVRGETGRDWLGDTLGLRGAQVAHVSAYRRVVPVLDSEQQAVVAEALRQPHRHGWLFSSSQAVANLALAIPQAAAVDWARSWALGTHPRIAERAAQAGFGRVSSVRPLLEAVVACIQSTEL